MNLLFVVFARTAFHSRAQHTQPKLGGNMKSEVSVFLLGFAPFEKSTFESFFKLAGKRDTLYKISADVTQAKVVVVNSDNSSAVQWVQKSVKSPQKAIYIGAPDPTGLWPAVSKPIKLTAILGMLDVLVLAGRAAGDGQPRQEGEGASVIPSPVEPPVASISERAQGSVRQGSGRDGLSDFGASSFLGLGKTPSALPTGQQYDDILIVDDDDSALKFMQKRITRYGFRAELAKTGKEALIRVSAGNYKFVFLEVFLQGIDGYQVCRSIKQNKYGIGKPPVVVMLTSRGASADKIRGGLAGCDAYLTKPLDEAELLKVLSKYDEQVERSFRHTRQGSDPLSSMMGGL
jgi:CheY-like chemotaxis protein